MAWLRRHTGLLSTALLALGVVAVYGQVVSVEKPSSQAASLAVVIDGLAPGNDEGLRIDLVASVDVGVLGCDEDVSVRAVISGTPTFWDRHAADLEGSHTLGVGLRTSYIRPRLLDWSGYDLPGSLGNIGVYGQDRVPSPSRSGQIEIEPGVDVDTGAKWYTVEVQDWGRHRTPLVLEFDAQWTSRRATAACYVVLPELVAFDDSAVTDARAAAAGASSAFEPPPGRAHSPFSGRDYASNAVTFGRVILNTEGHFSDTESRPEPLIVDRNPWATQLGRIGQEAGVWTCVPSPGREQELTPSAGAATQERAVPPAESSHAGCGGLAVVEARNAGTVRDLALLVIGGGFALVLERLDTYGRRMAGAWSDRRRSDTPPETASEENAET